MSSAWKNTGDAAAYLKGLRRFPMLTAERERELVHLWRDNGDTKALQELIGSHLRLVFRIAREHRGYGLPLEDLIAEGNLGLMEAVLRFDPDRGFRFSTYARWWIRAMIHEHVLKSWSLVRMGTTRAQKTLFFNLHRLKKKLDINDGATMSPQSAEAIARELNVRASDVLQMNQRLWASDLSLNLPSAENSTMELQDLLASADRDAETIVADSDELGKRRAKLTQALDRLNERERDILVKRKLSEQRLTLQTLSNDYGISRERVRQIEQSALEKVRAFMLSSGAVDSGPEPDDEAPNPRLPEATRVVPRTPVA
ncbi:MAG TPA: sigma-70 family RNA polymerase sigma factor [Kiloniellaceae bacterium]|nr:sigma-70 family RNA polymerase sigma factor [Kiloniellaceae bacterium]